jgi:hypothetical protein
MACPDDRILRRRLRSGAVPRELQPVPYAGGQRARVCADPHLTALAVVIVFRLHRYGKLSQVSASEK